jgi:2-(1,2-epoxy-1,2-dihydrophenyl)acetyl-CoA isomerase
MANDTILYEAADGIATITLNRPESLNALLPEMSDQLVALVAKADADDAVRAIVLTGAGKAFSAGADLKLMGRPDRLGRSALVGRQRTLHGAAVVEQLLRRDKPMLAAVNGVVAGMACSFVLACDFALASDTARFVFSFVKVGFIPDSGCTFLLPRRVGLANAQRLCLTAEPVGAAEALRLGLVTEVVPANQLAARARAVAASIAAQPPQAVRLARGLLERGASASFAAATQDEALAQGVLGETADHQEAVRAFAEKRAPVFTGK